MALETLRKPVVEVDILARMLPRPSFVGQARRSSGGDSEKAVKDRLVEFVHLHTEVRRNTTMVRQSDIAQ